MSLPMEKATYVGTATAVSFGQSSNGNTQIAVGFDLGDGQSITWIGHFTDKTTARTIESLMHMGWQGEDPTDLADLDVNAILVALPEAVELVCEPEEYNGNWTLKVQWVNKPGSGRFAFNEPLQGNALKAFGAQLKSTVRSVRASGGPPRKASIRGGQRDSGGGGRNEHPNAPGGPRDRDDIPF